MKQVAYGLLLAVAMICLSADGFFGQPGRAFADDPPEKAVPKAARKKTGKSARLGAPAPVVIDARAGVFIQGQAGQVIVVRQGARFSEQQLDQLFFQQERNAAGARERLDTLLQRQVEDVDRVCNLTEAQRNKLNLMGRGDIKHLFDRYEAVKQEYRSTDQSAPDFQEKWREISLEISALRTARQVGLFNGHSMFCKSLSNTLTAEQLARYEAFDREGRETRQHASIQTLVNQFDRQGAHLSEEQRRELTALLAKQKMPSRGSSPYDYYLMIYQLGRLPEEKLKPLFDESQWTILKRLLVQATRLEPTLRRQGLLADEDDEVDEREARPGPAAPKK